MYASACLILQAWNALSINGLAAFGFTELKQCITDSDVTSSVANPSKYGELPKTAHTHSVHKFV